MVKDDILVESRETEERSVTDWGPLEFSPSKLTRVKRYRENPKKEITTGVRSFLLYSPRRGLGTHETSLDVELGGYLTVKRRLYLLP